MADITAKMVKELREMTGAGMMECKKALVEAEGIIENAVDVLRKRGLAAAAKKAGRATNEGAVVAEVSEDGKTAALAEVNCETDFVARNEIFVGYANKICKAVLENNPADIDALKECKIGDETVADVLIDAIHTIGENMNISRIAYMKADNGVIASYTHLGGKIGVLVEFAFDDAGVAKNEEFKEFANDVALQVCAMNPVSVGRDSVPEDIVAHEMEIYKAQAAESGKPENIQEKIALGRMNKFYKEGCLLEQDFFKDTDITVDELKKKVSKSVGCEITIVAFERLVLGEASE